MRTWTDEASGDRTEMASYPLIENSGTREETAPPHLGPLTFLLNAGQLRLWLITAALIAVIALVDWRVGNSVSLGVLYILPMMSGAIMLGPRRLAVLAVVCSTLRYFFDTPGSALEVAMRFVFAVVAYYAAGLFVHALVNNRAVVMSHLSQIRTEQDLRENAERQMEMMVTSSAAAILTVGQDGAILAANDAAADLFLRTPGRATAGKEMLAGVNIRQFMPVLADALEMPLKPLVYRTAAQCQGRRKNGEVFQAHTWFSSYSTRGEVRLAAIIVDSSEEMREREGQKFQELARSSRITAEAFSHEIRNLCGAISVLAANLNARYGLAWDEDHRAMMTMVKGLEKVAGSNAASEAEPAVEATELRAILDDLRIVIEADWMEMNGSVAWPEGALPRVLGDEHGLLQVFLNLAKNSFRAVRDAAEQRLVIGVEVKAGKAQVSFKDTGSGVARPEQLFRPFAANSQGSGLGLYISRSMMRGYGGDLRYEASESGAVFVVELEVI